MALADDLAAASVPVKGPACRMGRWLADQDDDHQADILGAFRDARVSDRILAAWLSDHAGFKVTLNVVGHHRRNGCMSCCRYGFAMERGA